MTATELNAFKPVLDHIPQDHAFFRLSEKRQKRLLETASHRIHAIRLVVQDVDDPHNISACFRSAEALGIMDVHTIHARRPYRTNAVSRGVDRWLNIRTHKTIAECAQNLKNDGFCIAAGFPTSDALPITEMPLDKPIALVFGNEHDGVSAEWEPYLDYKFTIPMHGMVESMNISVSAAIGMYEARRRLPKYAASKADNLRAAGTASRWAIEHFERLRHKRSKG